MAYDSRDFYFRKAKKENYAARSIFKLQEIDERFRIFRQGDRVLDLGAAPGSWAQYASKKIGPQGRLLGIDLQPILLTLPNAVFVVGDMQAIDFEKIKTTNEFSGPFDVVLSDMAPKTTGIRITDQTRSYELCMIALSIADRHLKTKGAFVCKLFHSEAFEDFRKELQSRFSRLELLKPKSTRKESKEIFLIGISKK